MNTIIPIKNLCNLNWLLSFLCSFLLISFLAGFDLAFSKILIRFVETFTIISLISFTNLAFWILYSNNANIESKHFKLKLYASSYVAALFITWFVTVLYTLISGQKWEGSGPNIHKALTTAALSIGLVDTMILTFQTLVILQLKKTQSELENLRLQANVSEAANLLLRQQIHPHFLFNSLNTIKILYKKEVKQGEEYLLHLADFLRESISNHTTQNSLIESELAFCMNYLKMQKMRFGDSLNYTVLVSEKAKKTGYVPYFSLQPLVENALKHNEFTDKRPMLITIKEENGYLLVSNNRKIRKIKENSTGEGLSNLSKRYRLLGEEDIKINFDEDIFVIKLKILNK